MDSVFVYLELEDGAVAQVSRELLTRGRSLASSLGVKLEAVAIGSGLGGIEEQVMPYGTDVLHVFDDPCLSPYTTGPHAAILTGLFRQEKPQIALMGATVTGRDLGPRVSSALGSGLTADCTQLEIGGYEDRKTGKVYENLLYQIRPAFGGNIIATIVNPDYRPQMATVRQGVMKDEPAGGTGGIVIRHDTYAFVSPGDLAVSVIDRHMEPSSHHLDSAGIVVAGGYGMGSREDFQLLFDLAQVLHAEVGASRAAIDAGFCSPDRQIGQTGLTVRPKLYIACGISGQIQHIAGMRESSLVMSVNTDPDAPINAIADYVITGRAQDVIPKLIAHYRKMSK